MKRAYSSRPRLPAALALAVALCSLAVPGCGSTEPEVEAKRPVESADAVPKLPPGWTVKRNGNGGFAFGVPPGWRAKNKGIETAVRSPDGLVAGTIVADRSNEAIEFPLDELAETTIIAAGLRRLRSGDTRRFAHRYDAVAIEAQGVAGKQGIRQKILLAVVRKRHTATFTVLFARNAEQPTAAYDKDIRRIIRSLRGRPVG